MKGDFGYNCNYCNGNNHLTNDCMLRKMEEKKKKVKYEAYYAKRLEELCTQMRVMVCIKFGHLNLMTKGGDESDGMYQI